MLDQMGERYSRLPSQILREADTLDIYVWATVNAWQQRQRDSATRKPVARQLSQDKMLAMVKAAKERRKHRERQKS